MLYFCNRYPENNLFTLKKGLIPIEDMKRLPVRVTALFFFFIYLVVSLILATLRLTSKVLTFEITKKISFLLVICSLFRTFAPELVCSGSKKLSHEVTRHAEKPVKQLNKQCTQL